MKVLVVGLGSIGQRHVRNLNALLGDNVEFIACRKRGLNRVITENMRIEPNADIEQKFKIKVFNDLDLALEQKPDVAFICNPNSFHISTAFAAVRAGCNLFIEKALSHNQDGVEELISLVNEKKLVVLVGFQMRYHPCLLRLNSIIKEGVIGQVIAVRVETGSYLPDYHPYEDYRGMYEARGELGGGVIISQIHELDLIYWLFGLPKNVFAVGGHLSNLEMDVEDVASILMTYQIDGKLVPVHVHQDFIQNPPSRTCHVVGNNGQVKVDLVTQKITVFDYQGNIIEDTHFKNFQRNELYLKQLEHFLECLNEQKETDVSVEEGWQSLKIALAAKESLQTGKVVTL